MFDVNISSSDDALKAVEAALKELNRLEVFVGIPEEESSRGGEINNAELLYIHTHGSALKNIPPRPVLEPAIENNQDGLSELLQEAAKSAMDGDIAGVRPALEKTGMQAQNDARAWFDNAANNWTPNKPQTIKRKGSDKPLIDTGEMRKAIIYAVKEK